ncbi:MAG TPA: 16S rRNA (adenine(1518)-N(6)/adenine(1519)-N(6))-dimethyltransferase RsmA [Bryobacteraceae bacterium]|nr:16S rRNA (adenine(1518)-N(6)/adenine(1519)-N(6))-dimethyltransferase RsmA [Bryobacteraceae bacterium]
MAESACPAGTPQVIEIGPGQGALTEKLLSHVPRVVAMEMDPALAAHLRERWPEDSGLNLRQGDALSFDWTQWGPGVLAGNLPYYVASAMISKYLANPGQISQAVFLIQKEVAERIVAKPGTRDFGYFSVECQFLAKAEYLFTVPPGAFRPPPKVDSAVVRLTPLPPHPESGDFLAFASLCFRQKRKTLRNNLAARYPKDLLATIPAVSRRAEQLSVPELHGLFTKLRAADDSSGSR